MPPTVLRLQAAVAAQIQASVGQTELESGGILGADASGTLMRFCFDRGLRASAHCYAPDFQRFDHQIAAWEAEAIRFCGVVHSHAADRSGFSAADRAYIHQILLSFPELEQLCLLLVLRQAASPLLAYTAWLQGEALQIEAARLELA